MRVLKFIKNILPLYGVMLLVGCNDSVSVMPKLINRNICHWDGTTLLKLPNDNTRSLISMEEVTTDDGINTLTLKWLPGDTLYLLGYLYKLNNKGRVEYSPITVYNQEVLILNNSYVKLHWNSDIVDKINEDINNWHLYGILSSSKISLLEYHNDNYRLFNINTNSIIHTIPNNHSYLRKELNVYMPINNQSLSSKNNIQVDNPLSTLIVFNLFNNSKYDIMLDSILMKSDFVYSSDISLKYNRPNKNINSSKIKIVSKNIKFNGVSTIYNGEKSVTSKFRGNVYISSKSSKKIFIQVYTGDYLGPSGIRNPDFFIKYHRLDESRLPKYVIIENPQTKDLNSNISSGKVYNIFTKLD